MIEKNIDKKTQYEKNILATYKRKRFSGKHNEHTFILKQVESYFKKQGREDKIYHLDKKEEREEAIKYIRELERGNLTAIFQGKGTRPDILVVKKKDNILVDALTSRDVIAKKLNQYSMSKVNKVIIAMPPISNVEKVEIWVWKGEGKFHKLRYHSNLQK